VRVATEELAKPDLSPDAGLSLEAWEGVWLRGFEVAEGPQAGQSLRITFYWQATVPIDQDLVVLLRLVDDGGVVRWTSAGLRPVQGMYATNAWREGEWIVDHYELALPVFLPSGDYRLALAMVPAGSAGQATESVTYRTLGRVSVAPADPSRNSELQGGTPVRHGDGIWVLRSEAPAEVVAGSLVPVDLTVRLGDTASGARLKLGWVGAMGQPAPTLRVTATGDRQTVVRRVMLKAPETAGAYKLQVAAQGLGGEEGPLDARCGWGMGRAFACPLAQVKVLGLEGTAGLANFDDQLLLRSAAVPTANAAPGEAVVVELAWRSLGTMSEDYTLFVQLLGVDGRLHGQVDTWPAQGSYPTSQWPAGETLREVYRVPLNADAPPGSYRVLVGWYLLETMERLPVVASDGSLLGDSVTVGTFDVAE
jgi:hypothetical protein